MFISKQLRNFRTGVSTLKKIANQRYSSNLVELPSRDYNSYIQQTDSDNDAAEGNPIRYFYQDDIIQELTEMQRMHKLTLEEPRTLYNIKGVFPEVVEDFNFNALPEPSSDKSGEMEGAADMKLDKLEVDEAMGIILNLNKHKDS